MILLVALSWLVAGQASAEATPDVAATRCIACGAEMPNPRVLYTAGEWEALEGGAILLVKEAAFQTRSPGSNGHESAASGLIRHSPDRVWTVLTDFETWPKFMPHITRTRITRREGSKMWVRQNYRVVFVGMEHTTIYDLDPRFGQLSWALDPTQKHDIKFSEGRWELLPTAGGDRTVIRYAAAMDAGRHVPDFLETTLKRRSLKNLIVNLRREVDRRYGNGSAD
ncbi:MAG: SRPBCC family protein [Myxococcota bacterium]